jgi:anti-sigma regulatory factor (Ser/Thr protein kinase)
MVDATHLSFVASDRSYFSILKKEIHVKAVEAGFNEQKVGVLDIILAEMTSNLHKYANDGELLMGIFENNGQPYIELISIDNGPGMNDPQKMMTDGYSTTNTLGHGLGSIKRLSDYFDLYSQKGWGTIVLSRIYKNTPEGSAHSPNQVEIRPVIVAKPGEKTSGDGYYVKHTDHHTKLLVADGLGHGPHANFAVNEAVSAFKSCPYHSPVEILRYLHTAIKKTRGMVATVVVFDMQLKKITIAGIGNIAAKLFNSMSGKGHLSYNGIVGHNIPNTMNDQEMNFSDYQQLMMCSDGIKSRWDVSKYNGINRCDLTIQAAAIYKDFARRTDDMSVIAGKIPQR